MLKETGCGARSNQSKYVKGPAYEPTKKITDPFVSLDLAF